MAIEIKNGKVFVEGKETADPVLIGLAVLDAVESFEELKDLHIQERVHEMINSHNTLCMQLGFEHQMIREWE